MWIKWIATLVAFGALVQSAVACPAQCSCRSFLTLRKHTCTWDCACTDILYLSTWIGQNSGKVIKDSVNNPDSAVCSGTNTTVRGCSGTNTPVRAVTEASTSPSKCPGYVATTTTPTTTTPEIIPETTTLPQTVITTQKPRSLMNFNCSSIQERKNDGGDCGKPACTTLLNCANFLSCLCSTCALCKKR
uniref:Variable lymphocyte receptor B n=1 Tax=Lampetra planeri TaxID=7750 RepID=A0A6H2U150_LAMPL|nr:variable lymphocyte receptor B [Lampetra planeri]